MLGASKGGRKWEIEMKNTYRLERWRYHICRETQVFTNKAKAKKWLKESGWWLEYDWGECMIYVYVNNYRLDFDEVDKEWREKWFK